MTLRRPSASVVVGSDETRSNLLREAASPKATLRVCMVVSGFPPTIGGTERRTERLVLGLQNLGVEVVVLARRHRGLKRYEMVKGISVHRLGFASRNKLGALTYALHTLGLLAWRFRQYRVVHAQNTDTPLWIGFVAKLILRRRLFVTINSDPDVLFGPTRRAGRLRLRLMMRLTETVGALSPQMKQRLAEYGIKGRRIELLPGAVDTLALRPPTQAERRWARSKLELHRHQLVYLFVGRVHAVKGLDLLIRAWAELPTGTSRQLIILGDGPERENLLETTRRLRIHDVTFKPAIENVLTYLHAADVFVLPSQQEGLSNALLEAMAVGLPVVVSDLEGNRALVSHGENGLTFPARDVFTLAERLAALDSQELRTRLGQGAFETAQGYSIAEVAAFHHQLYARPRSKDQAG